MKYSLALLLLLFSYIAVADVDHPILDCDGSTPPLAEKFSFFSACDRRTAACTGVESRMTTCDKIVEFADAMVNPDWNPAWIEEQSRRLLTFSISQVNTIIPTIRECSKKPHNGREIVGWLEGEGKFESSAQRIIKWVGWYSERWKQFCADNSQTFSVEFTDDEKQKLKLPNCGDFEAKFWGGVSILKSCQQVSQLFTQMAKEPKTSPDETLGQYVKRKSDNFLGKPLMQYSPQDIGATNTMAQNCFLSTVNSDRVSDHDKEAMLWGAKLMEMMLDEYKKNYESQNPKSLCVSQSEKNQLERDRNARLKNMPQLKARMWLESPKPIDFKPD